MNNVIDKWTKEGQKLMEELKKASQLEVVIGYESGQASENGIDMVDIAARNEFGDDNVPSRPFMRKSIDNNEGLITNKMQELGAKIYEGESIDNTLNKLGEFQVEMVKKTIQTGNFTPNSPVTVARKGSSKPLIDTGQMMNTVKHKVRKKQ